MNKFLKFAYLLIVTVLLTACSSSSGSDDPVEEQKIYDGLNYWPTSPNADQSLKITFKAPSSSDLYGYTGDVYLYSGVVSEDNWMYQPSSWTDNQSKYKMTKDADNQWSITLSPTIRQWFASGTTPVTKLAIIVRSGDGTKKGINTDSYVTVTDNQYKDFQPSAYTEKTMPTGLVYGINYGTDKTSATLVLYDKDTSGAHKSYAHVVGDFNNWTLSNTASSQMYRDNAAGCWWIPISGLDANKEYGFQYCVWDASGNMTRLGDPYCHKILDPNNDSSISSSVYTDSKTYPTGAKGIVSVFKINEPSFAWSSFKISNPSNIVIYEMLLRDFTSTGGVGTGNLKLAMDKLDYLKSLGVNAIELMPVQEFDGNNSWGYNPSGYYFAMDKAYGTETMYKQFIEACHQKGLAVILDVVYNQATENSPFAKLYWDTTNSRPASNNPYFNTSAPHKAYSWYCDWNHESTLTRDYIKRSLKYMLTEYHIDGFRFDFTKGFTNKATSDDSSLSAYDASRVAILKDYYSTIHETNANALMICEHFCDQSEDVQLGAAGIKTWRNVNYAYMQSAMGWSESSSFANLTTWGANVTANMWVGYMESHDEERMAYKQSRWGNGDLKTDLTARMEQLATNAAFFLTVSGPKMIWQFGELGYDYSINSNSAGTTVDDKGSYRTDPKPVKWDYFNVSQRKNLYDMYAKILALRNANPTLFSQDSFQGWNVTESYWSSGRTLSLVGSDGKRLVVAGNFTNSAVSVSVPFSSTGTWYDYINGGSINVTSKPQSVSIPAHEFRIYTSFK